MTGELVIDEHIRHAKNMLIPHNLEDPGLIGFAELLANFFMKKM
jgi:hypothetical protein